MHFLKLALAAATGAVPDLIVTLIGSVGFPIVMCILMYRFISNQMEDMRKAIDNNTVVMAKILERIEAEEGETGVSTK